MRNAIDRGPWTIAAESVSGPVEKRGPDAGEARDQVHYSDATGRSVQ